MNKKENQSKLIISLLLHSLSLHKKTSLCIFSTTQYQNDFLYWRSSLMPIWSIMSCSNVFSLGVNVTLLTSFLSVSLSLLAAKGSQSFSKLFNNSWTKINISKVHLDKKTSLPSSVVKCLNYICMILFFLVI